MVKYFTAKRLAFLAVFTAIVFIATLLFRFPNPLMGYSNLGDAFIFLIAAFFGPLPALISGAIGSALADVLSGFAIYAPFTFVVKGAEGALAGILLRAFLKTGLNRHVAVLIAFLLASCEMMIGYFFTNALLYGGFVSAAGAVLNDVLQGAVGTIAAYVFILIFSKSKTLAKFLRSPLHAPKKDADSWKKEVHHDENNPT